MRNMIYIDSNVFIYAALSPDSDEDAINSKNILKAIFEGKILASTSTLTWDEVVWAIKRFEDRETAIIEGKKFLTFPKLKILNVGEKELRTAIDLMKKYRLDPRDSIHVACCIENDIGEIVTNDSDFNNIVGVKRIPLNNVL